MRKKFMVVLYFMVTFILFLVYLIGIGMILIYIFNKMGIPQEKYIEAKKFVHILIVYFAVRFTLVPFIQRISLKIKAKGWK